MGAHPHHCRGLVSRTREQRVFWHAGIAHLTYTPIIAAPRDIPQGQLDAAVRELRTLREAATERPARTAFVTFRSRAAAACAAQTLSSPNGLLWTVRPAPPPAQVGCASPHRNQLSPGFTPTSYELIWRGLCVQEPSSRLVSSLSTALLVHSPRTDTTGHAQVYWPNLQLRWWQRQVRYMQVVAAMVFVCVWFMVPVTFAQSLTSASSIQAVASYLAPTVRAQTQAPNNRAAVTASPHVSPNRNPKSHSPLARSKVRCGSLPGITHPAHPDPLATHTHDTGGQCCVRDAAGGLLALRRALSFPVLPAIRAGRAHALAGPRGVRARDLAVQLYQVRVFKSVHPAPERRAARTGANLTKLTQTMLIPQVLLCADRKSVV